MDNFKPIQHKEEWLNRKWRPLMAYTYMAICIFDFILGPILNYAFFAKLHATFNAWKPLTLSEGGLFHMAMGAILGVAAFTRGQEKVTRYSRDQYESPMPYEERRPYSSKRQSQDVID